MKCPKCNWEPTDEAEWECMACGYEWDVFETAGRCPRCHEQQENTFCIEWLGGCGELSPHLDWYRGLDQGLVEINVRKLFDQ